jgi:hypothetical protein
VTRDQLKDLVAQTESAEARKVGLALGSLSVQLGRKENDFLRQVLGYGYPDHPWEKDDFFIRPEHRELVAQVLDEVRCAPIDPGRRGSRMYLPPNRIDREVYARRSAVANRFPGQSRCSLISLPLDPRVLLVAMARMRQDTAASRRNDAARCCARADRVRSGGPVPTAPERVGVATACLPGLRLSGDMP